MSCFKHCLTTICVALLLTNFSAYGAVITQTVSWDLSEDFYVTGDESFSRKAYVPFQLFNSSLGELTRVDYNRTSGAAFIGVFVENSSPESGFANFRYYVNAYYTKTALSGESLMLSAIGGASLEVSGNQEQMLVAGGGLDSWGYYPEAIVGPSVQAFLGAGTFNLDPRIDFNFILYERSPEVEILVRPNYAFTYELTYTYIPAVPEPESYALMLAGLGLLGYAARRQKRCLK